MNHDDIGPEPWELSESEPFTPDTVDDLPKWPVAVALLVILGGLAMIAFVG